MASRSAEAIIDLRENDKSRYFAIIDFDNCFTFDHQVCFTMNILRKLSDVPFSRKSDRKKEKSVASFTNEQNIIRVQTQLDGIAHEQTIICSQQESLCHVVGSRPAMKRKKKLLRMIMLWIETHQL